MTAYNVIEFALMLLKPAQKNVLAHHGAREGNSALGLEKICKEIEGILRSEEQQLKSTNMPEF